MSTLKERLKKAAKQHAISTAKSVSFNGEKMLVIRPSARIWRHISEQIINEFKENYGFDPSLIEESEATPEQKKIVELFNVTTNLHFQALYIHDTNGEPLAYSCLFDGIPVVDEEAVNQVTDIMLSSEDFKERFSDAMKAANENPTSPEQ